MKINIVGKTMSGVPVNIVKRLREMDFGDTIDIDGYINRISEHLGFDISGDTIEDRCENFLKESAKNGWAEMVE